MRTTLEVFDETFGRGHEYAKVVAGAAGISFEEGAAMMMVSNGEMEFRKLLPGIPLDDIESRLRRWLEEAYHTEQR
jgi:hypothetical protein